MGLLKLNRIQILSYGVPLLVILSSILIALSPLLRQYPELAMGITLDLTLLSPLLFLLFSRGNNIPKIRVVPIFIIGTVVAAYILPKNGQYHLNIISAYMVPLVELTVFFLVALRVFRTFRSLKLEKTASDDLFVIIKRSTLDIMGRNRFTQFLASEIAIFYYSLFAWRRKKQNSQGFTNYKESGSIALTGAFLMIVFIETIAFHLFLMRWSEIAAWTLTILSIYTAIVIFGHLKALILRPSLLTEQELILKNGIIADIKVNLDEIDKVEFCSKEISSEDLKIANLGLTKESSDHNVAIYFKRPQTLEKAYGFTKVCDVLLLSIDNKNEFMEKVNFKIQQFND